MLLMLLIVYNLYYLLYEYFNEQLFEYYLIVFDCDKHYDLYLYY